MMTSDVQGTQQISALLRDNSLLDNDEFMQAGSYTSQDDPPMFSKDDSISVATSDDAGFDNMYDSESNNNGNGSKRNSSRRMPPSTGSNRNSNYSNFSNRSSNNVSGRFANITSGVGSKVAHYNNNIIHKNTSNNNIYNNYNNYNSNNSNNSNNNANVSGRMLNKKMSIASDDSFATTVYTEETIELREGEKIRQMKKQNKKMRKHNKNDSYGSVMFQKRSIHSNMILPAQALNAKNINNPKQSQILMNAGAGAGADVSGGSSGSGLTSQLKNYYGGSSPIFGGSGKIRESVDMDSSGALSGSGANTDRNRNSSGSVPLERKSVIVNKSVLTLRQRTQFPNKQIRVKMYLPHEPEDEEPQQLILFINPGAEMGFVKQFLEDSYPHKYLQGRIKQLCIADEDGDIDDDFPPIDPNQDITRLGVMNFYIDVSFPSKGEKKHLRSIDSGAEVDKFSTYNTVTNAPDLPASLESFDTPGMVGNGSNGSNRGGNAGNNGYKAARRLSAASKQINEHRKSLSLEEQNNYFEVQPKRRGCCFCCCGGGGGGSSGAGDSRSYSYRVDKNQAYADAGDRGDERLLGTYEPPMTHFDANFSKEAHISGMNGNSRIEMGTGARGTYNNKQGRGASVMSSDTTASNRQFGKV